MLTFGISFIILTWNSEKYIKDCLNSIFNLEYDNIEVIVIDNNSIDKTKEIISFFPKVTLVELDKNYGTTYPRNIGLKRSNQDYKYICILDSDTIINHKAIENMIQSLEAKPEYLMAVPRMINTDGESQISYKKFPTLQIKLFKAFPIRSVEKIGSKLERYNFDLKQEIYEIDYGISACWMMKRKVLNDIGYLDEDFFYAPEDVDYCLRVWKSGNKVILATKSIIVHATQRISKKRLVSKHNFYAMMDLMKYFIKHKYLFSAKMVRRIEYKKEEE